MKKNKLSIKQRRAQAKRGEKNFSREKATKDAKHLRIAKRKKIMDFKKKKLEDLIGRLGGQEGSIVDQEMKNYMDNTSPQPLGE